jgi:hypothetical protein
MKKIIYFTLLLLPIPGLCNNTQVSEKDTLVNLMREALDDMLKKSYRPLPILFPCEYSIRKNIM